MDPLAPSASPPRGVRFLLPFVLWLIGFYSVWLGLVLAGDHWGTLVRHWPMAAAMAFGSYVAGSTPMGGGTVGFPILVLLFDQPATLGRDFSFAVQSIGMTSATIFILSRRQELEWTILRWALLGSLAGTPLGILVVAPHTSELIIKLLFAVVWASFGMMHCVRLREICSHHGVTPAAHAFDRRAGLLVGFLGGATVASITGVGIDMMLYTVLVLLCHADLKVAIPTTVILMAFTSVIGIMTKLAFTGVEPGVYGNWLAAAPVVALGAPLGAFIVNRIGRRPTLLFVSLLCLGQFGWTLHHEAGQLGPSGWIAAFLGLLAFNAAFHWLWRTGNRLERRSALPDRIRQGIVTRDQP